MNLQTLFNPSSIAIIGASRNPQKVGSMLLANSIRSGFRGNIIPINPLAKKIGGLPAYPSVTKVPLSIDVAIICVPAKVAPAVLVECGKKRIPYAIIISSGFKETGAKGAALERRVIAAAARHHITILGPNCLGFINAYKPLNASFTATQPKRGTVSMISQSGAIIGSFIDWASERHVGASLLVSCGNAAGIQEIDILDLMMEDAHTAVIGMYLEEVHNAPQFMVALSRVTRKKPVVVLKVGRSAMAAKAALSHTGSLVASDAALRAAFSQCGATLVDDLEQFFNCLQLLQTGKAIPPDIVVISNAGGPAIIAVDTIASTSLRLTFFDSVMNRLLQKTLPSEAATANPVDLLGDADLVRFKKVIALIERRLTKHTLCIIVTPQAMTPLVALARFFVERDHKRRHALVVSFMGGSSTLRARSILHRGGVPVFDFPNDALATLDRCVIPQNTQRSIYIAPRAEPTNKKKIARKTHLLTYRETTALLRRHAIPFIEGGLCRRESDISRIPSYPIVLKAMAGTIIHKKQAGAIILPIHNQAEALSAFRHLQQKFHGRALEGIIAQSLQKEGVEFFIGLKREPTVGTFITFGIGGGLVEMLHDFSMKLLPIQKPDAEDMLVSLHNQQLLTNLDKSYILDLLLKVSTMALKQKGILELDLNPIIMYRKGGAIVDARIVYGA